MLSLEEKQRLFYYLGISDHFPLSLMDDDQYKMIETINKVISRLELYRKYHSDKYLEEMRKDNKR
jgi:hypothetical protein